jgi:tetratricopeptide (TPR) repeat protein
MVGEVLGHYRIVKEIGAGGAGVVYQAWDERLERDVAVKILSGRRLPDDADTLRLRREALALSRTNHPNIATVHDFDSHGGIAFLVMELIPGSSLAERISSGPLSEREVVDFGSQLTAGLAVAHARGVIHRDLKPGNVRVTPDGRLKILDFGLARVLASHDAETVTDTEFKAFAGTIAYMAPEQFQGRLPDVRTDIYGVGAMLYEMATGRRPFTGASDGALIHAILHQPLVSPSAVAPGISPGLEAVIVKALDRDPGLRYQSAAELQVDLQRLTGRTSDGARSPRPGPRSAVLYLVLIAALIGGVAAVWHLTRTVPPPAPRQSAGAERLRVAIMLPELIGGARVDAGWPTLIQTLLASGLAGAQEVSIVDQQSLVPDTSSASARLRALAAGNVGLAVRLRILPVQAAHELECSVIETAQEEVTFSTRVSLPTESDLRPAVQELSEALTDYFRLRLIGAELDEDLRPWISLRAYKVQAVRAFVQAAQYVFRYQPGEPQRYYQRALEIDPSFVAPRIWRASSLLGQGKRDLVEADLAHLRTLEPQASPFEQAMIGFLAALLADDLAAQARHHEVALRYAPGNRILLVNLGYIQEQQGDCRAALQTIQPLVDQKWIFAPLYPFWARCAIAVGRFDDARRVLEGSLAIGPPWPDVYAFLDGLAVIGGRPDDSAKYAKLLRSRLQELSAETHSEESAMAYQALGDVAASAGQPAQAVMLFEKAVEFAPESPEYRDKLAGALFAVGRTRESTEQRNRAAALRRGGR